jgi:hypothetical protein
LQGAPALACAGRSAGGQHAARNPCYTLALTSDQHGRPLRYPHGQTETALAACRYLLLIAVIGCLIIATVVLLFGVVLVITTMNEVLHSMDFSIKHGGME